MKTEEELLRIEERRNVKVGDGVTRRLYTDKTAYTVVARTAKTLTLQEDTATLADGWKPEFVAGGFSGHCVNNETQTYTYTPNPNAPKVKAFWSEKSGAFKVGNCMLFNGRNKIHDYNF